MSEGNGNGDVVDVYLDTESLMKIMGGGKVDVPQVGIRIQAGGCAARRIWDLRRRINGGVHVQKPLPKKDC